MPKERSPQTLDAKGIPITRFSGQFPESKFEINKKDITIKSYDEFKPAVEEATESCLSGNPAVGVITFMDKGPVNSYRIICYKSISPNETLDEVAFDSEFQSYNCIVNRDSANQDQLHGKIMEAVQNCLYPPAKRMVACAIRFSKQSDNTYAIASFKHNG